MLHEIKKALSNLAARPATRMYPKVVRKPFEKNRGQLQNDMERCILCGICQRACPSGCIRVDRASKVWEYNPFQCILCGVCVERCPRKTLQLNICYRKPADRKYSIKLSQGS